MNDLMQYFARILGAMLLIKYASMLVKDAESLIVASAKARLPEVADELDSDEVVLTEFDAPSDVGAHTHRSAIRRHTDESYSSLTGDGPNIHTTEDETDATED